MTDISRPVKEFIVGNFLFGADDGSLGEEDSFLESGIIDSTGILEVVAWVEETFGFKVKDEDLLPENFDSVKRLVAIYRQRTLRNDGEGRLLD